MFQNGQVSLNILGHYALQSYNIRVKKHLHANKFIDIIWEHCIIQLDFTESKTPVSISKLVSNVRIQETQNCMKAWHHIM